MEVFGGRAGSTRHLAISGDIYIDWGTACSRHTLHRLQECLILYNTQEKPNKVYIIWPQMRKPVLNSCFEQNLSLEQFFTYNKCICYFVQQLTEVLNTLYSI